jgi:hypothetical protein
LNDDESNVSISQELKLAIAEGIIWGTSTILKQTMEREKPKQRAAHDSNRFGQSKSAITDNTISINILTNDQKLPARPRDFRSGLANEEMNIGNSELSDVSASLCRRLILERSKKSSSNPRGRPVSSADPSNETRGRKSYYDTSRVKQIIDQVLNDQESFKIIDKAITGSDIYFKHRKYSIEVALHQLKSDKEKFLNTYRPILKKYGIKEMRLSDASIREDITDDLIERIATYLARDTKPTDEQRRGMYIHGGVIYFDHIMQKT